MDNRDRYQKREVRPSKKIYISNLSIDTTQPDLRKNFEQYGTIVDISLKNKDTGIVFAFIEYDSVQSAQKAIEAMNKKTIMEKQLKVEFAKGLRQRNDRDRDRDRGFRGDRDRDRGDRDRGYRGRGDDRRGGASQRPKGCFNCGEQGHYVKDCTKPRQPRQYNRERSDRDGGSYRGSRDYRGNDRRGPYRKKDQSRSRSKSDSRSRSRSNQKKRKSRKRSQSSSRSP